MKLLIVATVLSVVLGACTGLDISDEPSTAAPDSGAPATAPTASSTPDAGDAVSQRCGGGSLEGCFTYYEMDEYLDAVMPMVAQFFEKTYERFPAPRDRRSSRGWRASPRVTPPSPRRQSPPSRIVWPPHRPPNGGACSKRSSRARLQRCSGWRSAESSSTNPSARWDSIR